MNTWIEIMSFGKAIIIWLIIMAAESVNGTVREFIIAPALGTQPAHQISFIIGATLIIFISWLTAPWINAKTFKIQLQTGSLWLILLLAFEFGVSYIRGDSLEQALANYNLAQGGLMSFGLIIMLLAPVIGARLRFIVK